MNQFVTRVEDLDVFKRAMDAAMEIFTLSRNFPREERHSLVDQIRRSSRSVAANLAEAWHKRQYRPAFIAKLSDSEAEAAETLVWLDFAHRCNYLDKTTAERLHDEYDHIVAQLVRIRSRPDPWLTGSRRIAGAPNRLCADPPMRPRAPSPTLASRRRIAPREASHRRWSLERLPDGSDP